MLVSAGSGGVNVFVVKRWMDLFLESLAATAAALLLALIARDEIGMPLQMIREDALIGASVLIGAFAGIYSRKPRQKL
jgi:hypothetical protein